MKRKTLYTEQYIDCEYDIEFDDILDLIESCDEDELQKIRNSVGANKKSTFIRATLDDEQKYELLKVAMKKYSYQELVDKLDIKPYEIF